MGARKLIRAARAFIAAARDYWVSLVVGGAVVVGLLVLVVSQRSGNPSRAIAASAAAFDRHVSAVETQASQTSARDAAAQAALDRSVARQSAAQDRQGEALARQEGAGAATGRDRGGSPSHPHTTSRIAVTGGGGGASASHTHTSLVAVGGGPGSLTATQVRAAEQGTIDVLKLCLDDAKGDYGAEGAAIPAAVKGEGALENAVQQDPDTRYKDLVGASGGTPQSMRQLAAMVASPQDLAQGGACTQDAQDMLTVLDGLPS